MPPPPPASQEVLLLSGRAGVGKTSVAHETSELLAAAGVAHCLIDGDNLDAAHPRAAQDPDGTALTEANLAALWANYAAIGHHRMIYVNTSAVLLAPMIVRAMGGRARALGILLTATDQTTLARLAGREIGSTLDRHVRRSATMDVHLRAAAGDWVARVPTDGRTVGEIAADVIATTGWAPDH